MSTEAPNCSASHWAFACGISSRGSHILDEELDGEVQNSLESSENFNNGVIEADTNRSSGNLTGTAARIRVQDKSSRSYFLWGKDYRRVSEELRPIERPSEPVESDIPLKCPQPVPSIANDGIELRRRQLLTSHRLSPGLRFSNRLADGPLNTDNSNN